LKPCSPAEAVERALLMVGRPEEYRLGSGDYHPTTTADLPWTNGKRGYGCDCSGFIAWAFKYERHRPGFNHGSWSSVSDDVSTDSMCEDGEHRHELFTAVDRPMVGDLLCYPGIRGPDGKRLRIGHVGLIVGVPAEWDPKLEQFGLVDVVQCQAARKPAVMRGPGLAWLMRDTFKGLRDEAWRTRVLRVG
jgi:hypothetical protein